MWWAGFRFTVYYRGEGFGNLGWQQLDFIVDGIFTVFWQVRPRQNVLLVLLGFTVRTRISTSRRSS